MKKIKITESQKGMLEAKAAAKLKEDVSYSQSGSKAVGDAFKGAGANKIEGMTIEGIEEPTEVQMSELAPKVLDFIKQLYTNPSKEALDPFWESIDVEWDELIQLLTELELIKSVSGGYRLQKLERVGGPTAVVKIVSKLVQKLITDKNTLEPIMGETDINDPIRKELSNQLPTEPQRTGKTRDEILKVIAAKRAEELKRRASENSRPIDEIEGTYGIVGNLKRGEDLILGDIFKFGYEESQPMFKYVNKVEGELILMNLNNGDILKLKPFTMSNLSLIERGNGKISSNGPEREKDRILKKLDGQKRLEGSDVRPIGETEGQTTNTLDLEFYLDEIALFSKGGKLYLYNVDTADEGEYADYASRTETPLGREDGQMDVEYGEWEMNGEIVNAYVNNNLEHLSTGKGLNDYESGVELVEIDKELAQDLLGLTKYIKDPKAAEQLNNVLSSIGLDEMSDTGSVGGSWVGALGKGPISRGPIAKSNVGSEMEDIVDSEEEQVEPAMGHARRLLNSGNVTPQEWLSYGNELKQVVDEMRDDSSIGYLAAYLVHMLQLAEKGMEDKFNAVRDRLVGKLADPKHNMQLEMDSVSAGGDSGTFAYDANALGTDDFMTAGNKQNKTMPMIKKGGVNEVVAREGKNAKTDTQWPDGQFVEFDDCVKYNNNKVAQNGGCSTGAVDNVVKTKGSKNSVISDASIYESIAKETRRTIEEVKSILSRKNKKSK